MREIIMVEIFLVIFLIGVRLYYYYKIISNKSSFNKNEVLLKGKALSVTRFSSYVTANLSVHLKLENGETVAVNQSYRNTLRWWLQKIPKVNDDIYMYCSKDKFELHKQQRLNHMKGLKGEEIALSVYAISPNSPPTRFKKAYDLLFEFEFGIGIIFFVITVALLFLGIKLGENDPILYHTFNYFNFLLFVYVFVNFFLVSIIL